MVRLQDMPMNEVESLAEAAALEAMRRRQGTRAEPAVDMGKSPDTFHAIDKDYAGTISGQGRVTRTPETFNLDNIDSWMTFQPWDRQQQDAGVQVREALITAAKVIFRNVPAGLFRDECIKDLIRMRMDANAAISFKGRF